MVQCFLFDYLFCDVCESYKMLLAGEVFLNGTQHHVQPTQDSIKTTKNIRKVHYLHSQGLPCRAVQTPVLLDNLDLLKNIYSKQ